MSLKNFAQCLSAARLASTSASRISRSSSGSVPSTARLTPRLRKSSSTSTSASSRVSRPSRRALSASLTTTGTSSPGGDGFQVKARTSALTAALVSAIVPPATAAPMVPPNTSSIAGRISSEAGLPPSRTFAAMMMPRPPPTPIRVALSIRRSSARAGPAESRVRRTVTSLRSKAPAVAMIRARNSSTLSRTSSIDSATRYLVPSTRVMTVSGVQSTRSTRSGLSANSAPVRRVSEIICAPSLCGRACEPSLACTCVIGRRTSDLKGFAVPVRPGRGRTGDAVSA